MCQQSLEAIAGAIATVVEAVDISVRGVRSQKTPAPATDIEEALSHLNIAGRHDLASDALNIPVNPANVPLPGTPPEPIPSSTKTFAVIRPPGHHCSDETPSGFCFVNNVLIAAAHGEWFIALPLPLHAQAHRYIQHIFIIRLPESSSWTSIFITEMVLKQLRGLSMPKQGDGPTNLPRSLQPDRNPTIEALQYITQAFMIFCHSLVKYVVNWLSLLREHTLRLNSSFTTGGRRCSNTSSIYMLNGSTWAVYRKRPSRAVCLR